MSFIIMDRRAVLQPFKRSLLQNTKETTAQSLVLLIYSCYALLILSGPLPIRIALVGVEAVNIVKAPNTQHDGFWTRTLSWSRLLRA